MMKYPEVGRVKERLAHSIGDKSATSLYRMFVRDILTTVKFLDIPFHIAVYPQEAGDRFRKWLGPSTKLFYQKGLDLGERLHNGFITMFEKGFQNVIALASDSPDLPVEILQQAVSCLFKYGAVIGPAFDGGYYLIGFSRDSLIPDVFEDISWSTESVFQETLSRISSVGQRIHVLPEWADIDTKRDLQKFFEKHNEKPSRYLHTMNYLYNNPDLIRLLES